MSHAKRPWVVIALWALPLLLMIWYGSRLGPAPEPDPQDAPPVAKPTEPPAATLPATSQETSAPPADVASVTTPLPDPMQSQLADIANAYRASMHYPDYSRPLRKSDWNLLNPRVFVPRNTSLASAEGVSASIVVDHFVVDAAHDLPVRVLVTTSGDSTRATAYVSRVDLQLGKPGKSAGSVVLTDAGQQNNARIFAGSIPAELLQAAGEGEVVLSALLAFSTGITSSVTAMIKVYSADARLTYLGDAYIDGPHLMIPAHFEVIQEGFYRMQANLFDKSGEQPISHLNATFMLSESSPTGLLKVHATTLRAQQSAGPYELRDFDIRRSASRPGDPPGYGSSDRPSFSVRGFSLDSYSNQPYVDPRARQRLDFLDRLSGESR